MSLVQNFDVGSGGIGDFLAFQMQCENYALQNSLKVFLIRKNIDLQKYFLLIDETKYITLDNCIPMKEYVESERLVSGTYYNVYPHNLYCVKPSVWDTIESKIPFSHVFRFHEEVLSRARQWFDVASQYICIHLRLGDKYLETDSSFVLMKEDARPFSETFLFSQITHLLQEHLPIVFLCDNRSYKRKVKESFPGLIITDAEIGHSSLSNTTSQQILDGIAEFSLLCHSSHIYSASRSNFSRVASNWFGRPITYW